MKQQFLEAGYKVVDFEDKADIYVINTCTVTNMADRKSRQALRRVKHENPGSILVVVGCYVQTYKNELEDIEEIDLVLGNNEKKEIVKYVEQFKTKVTDVMYQKEYIEFGTTTYTDKTRAVIKVQDGCDRFCSYCIIPYARGRVRSRKVENVIEEVKEIAKKGIKEIVITGIHIASYGKDFNYEITLLDLLEELNKIDGIERIRLGSLEPRIMTEEFIKRLKKLNKICNHFHLSLQSGCSQTLKRMNRKYTADEFEKCVKLLRENFENVLLTADVIVGFPGETEEEFADTYNFLKRIQFYKIHVFKYSPRKGTKAAEMDNQIDGSIKEKRSKDLIELSNRFQKEYENKMIGTYQKVLFEQEENGIWQGHTSNYVLVKLKTDKNIENKIINVQIEKSVKGSLIAVLNN